MEKQVKEKQCEHSQKILELQNHLKEVQFEVNCMIDKFISI